MNKTLRFTSLKYMDDRTESLTGEGTDLGKFIFSSSWSELEDNIPQWAMYGDSSKGVCIKMESFPFKNNYEQYREYASKSEDLDSFEEASELYINPPQYMFDQGFILSPSFIEDGQNVLERRRNAKVLYTTDETKLLPNIINKNDEGVQIEFGKLGIYKNDQWSFQKEWRYKTIYTPFDIKKFPQHSDTNFGQQVIDKIFSEEHPVVKYVDYNIDEKYFDTTEIICGAMMDEFDFNDLIIFCKGINTNIKVKRSNLFKKWTNKSL